jgi:ureidoacrylate peracid hydrolase
LLTRIENGDMEVEIAQKKRRCTMNLIERIQPECCALLIIDIQNDFCHQEGACSKKGNDVQNVRTMLPRLELLLDHARNKGITVIFIRTEHNELVDSTAWNSRYGMERKRPPSEINCRTGSWGAEFYEIEPKNDELMLTKNRYSGFVGTNLDLLLKSLKKTSLLLTGVATNVCVESTLRDGLSLDYYVTLVKDCCAAYDSEDHNSTVRNVQNQFGIVTDSNELIGLWNS